MLKRNLKGKNFTIRCKLRSDGKTIEVVVIDHDTLEISMLSWDFTSIHSSPSIIKDTTKDDDHQSEGKEDDD